ncbi:MAG: hypothetical protein SVR08_17730 [Spirochaetota bacterium]|nr:hypothetical protein [Spirochaetota bacterium]
MYNIECVKSGFFGPNIAPKATGILKTNPMNIPCNDQFLQGNRLLPIAISINVLLRTIFRAKIVDIPFYLLDAKS